VNTTPHGRGPRVRSLAAVSAAIGVAAPALAPASADAAPAINVRASKHVLVGHKVKVRGQVKASGHRTVRVQRSKGHGWKTVDSARTDAGGRFSAAFRGRHVGGMKVRVVAAGTASASKRTTVYRKVEASYYGPGLYGNRLACGGRLHRGTIGVANKTLPCGTRVKLRYRGRQIAVKVIDRGPYSGNRVYDLTEATKERLHFPSTGRVWSSR
jgi:rare lipoprotein A